MNPMTETAALACVPDAIPAAERDAHVRLARRLFEQRTSLRPIEDRGYRATFAASAFDEVARWITHERLCCPFLRFEVAVWPARGPIALTMTGPAGTRELLDAELGLMEVAR
ncbi:MAG TPA: hypothetical protein VF039_09405 [Longimicrobiales bacterium]